MDRRTLTVTLACLLLPVTVQAQEKYTIKLKELGQGESARVEKKESESHKGTITLEIDKKKDVKVEEGKYVEHLLYTETILEWPAGAKRPTKVKRVYEKASREGTRSSISGGGKGVAPPYHGKTVLIEKKGDKYEFHIEGGDILPTDPDLDSEFNRGDEFTLKKLFLPPGPVAINETWKVDPKIFLGDSDKKDGIENLKTTGVVRLVKVYKQNGRLYGVIDADVNMEAKSLLDKGAKPGDGNSLTMKMTLKLTFEGCIDGTVAEGRISGTGTVSTNATMVVPPLSSMMVGNVSGTVEGSWKELPRK